MKATDLRQNSVKNDDVNDFSIDCSRYIAADCGEGELLMELLSLRLQNVHRFYSENRAKYEINTIKVVTELYGIDLDNNKVLKCISNLLDIVIKEYNEVFGDDIDPKFLRLIKIILQKNIMYGDSLSLYTPDGFCALHFPEWEIIGENRLIFNYHKFYELYKSYYRDREIVFVKLISEPCSYKSRIVDGCWEIIGGSWSTIH